MKRKHTYLILTAAGAAFGVGSAVTHAAPIVQLSITATDGYWTAYAQTDSGTDNIGLATFSIDVVGSGGAAVTASYDEAPISTNGMGGTTGGFDQSPSNGVGGGSPPDGAPGNGIAIDAAQTVSPLPGGVIQGFGKGAAGELAEGTYSDTGADGMLSVNPDLSIGLGIQSLDIVSDGKWVGPSNIVFDTVIPGAITVAPVVPEPASASVLALSAIGLLARKRRRMFT